MFKYITDKYYYSQIYDHFGLLHRPGYDMEHVFNYQHYTVDYWIEKVIEIEKQYDYLSIIRPHETPQQ